MTPDTAREDRAVGLIRRLVDHLPSMIAYWDRDQRCRFANRAYERWFSVAPEALIGTHIRDLLGPIYELNQPYIEGALRGEPQEFEREIPDPMGGPARHSLACYVPDASHDGSVRGFFVLVTDISRIKHAQIALHASEARFATMIATASDAIIATDSNQRITIFNPRAENIFGRRREDVVGHEIAVLVPARMRVAMREQFASILSTPGASDLVAERDTTFSGLRDDGSEFPLELSISKAVIDDKPMLTIALRDITDARRAEIEQRVLAEAGLVLASSLNYKQTLRSTAELVVRHAADLCVVDMIDEETIVRLTAAHVDPAKAQVCEQLVQLALEPGHTLGSSVHESRQPQIFDDINDAFMVRIAQNDQHLRLLRALAPRSALVVPLLSADHALGAIVFASSRPRNYTVRDIGFATELARRAALAIENARLYESAQRAMHARDEVLAIVAHDVRSPLNAIFLNTQLLERKLVRLNEGLRSSNLNEGLRPSHLNDESALENVHSLQRSLARANHLIEDLLDVSRSEAGPLALVRTGVSVSLVVAEVKRLQQLIVAEAGITLETEVAESLPEIWADRSRLLQVLENLVGNALKFTPPGGRITLRAIAIPGHVQFSVADTGCGISAENLRFVFDRFWQARRDQRSGAGLGLPICKGIVESHGGKIWVESTPGTGTTFFFTLPTFDTSS